MFAICACNASTVHPRSRGEHSVPLHPAGLYDGSSPLARGTHTGTRGERHEHRFIPARAGNTRRARGRPDRNPVHPRSRGEHVDGVRVVHRANGSSPLARGTPAPSRAARPRTAVHPRSRGEHDRARVEALRRYGSSPLARGTREMASGKISVARFIPARAGNTKTPALSGLSLPVHPRSRGEHRRRREFDENIDGSSPLARGTHVVPPAAAVLDRFIPARAGNTTCAVPGDRLRTVHPRSRGEHPTGRLRAAMDGGSSPLARGTRCCWPSAARCRRFIPARAGNTPAPRRRRRAAAVHPRSRGEHTGGAEAHRLATGSSPLARGTPHRGGRWPQTRRFIPARAGNTRSRTV